MSFPPCPPPHLSSPPLPLFCEREQQQQQQKARSLTSVNDASRALASTPPAGRMLVVRSTAGAGAGARSAMVFCFLFPSRAARVSRRFVFVRVGFLVSVERRGGREEEGARRRGRGAGERTRRGRRCEREKGRGGWRSSREREREEREERKERSRFPALCSAPSRGGGGLEARGASAASAPLGQKTRELLEPTLALDLLARPRAELSAPGSDPRSSVLGRSGHDLSVIEDREKKGSARGGGGGRPAREDKIRRKNLCSVNGNAEGFRGRFTLAGFARSFDPIPGSAAPSQLRGATGEGIGGAESGDADKRRR